MNSIPSPTPPFRPSKLLIVFLILTGLLLTCGLGIASHFRLSSDTQALRAGVMNSVAGRWHKKIAVHVGWPTMTLVRTVSHFFKVPKEPAAVLDAVRGAEVGIYRLENESVSPDYAAIFRATDKTMTARGWARIIGVAKDSEFVAVYMPAKGIKPHKVACCVVVLHDQQLVVVNARGNPQPLLALASKRLKIES